MIVTAKPSRSANLASVSGKTCTKVHYEKAPIFLKSRVEITPLFTPK